MNKSEKFYCIHDSDDLLTVREQRSRDGDLTDFKFRAQSESTGEAVAVHLSLADINRLLKLIGKGGSQDE